VIDVIIVPVAENACCAARAGRDQSNDSLSAAATTGHTSITQQQHQPANQDSKLAKQRAPVSLPLHYSSPQPDVTTKVWPCQKGPSSPANRSNQDHQFRPQVIEIYCKESELGSRSINCYFERRCRWTGDPVMSTFGCGCFWRATRVCGSGTKIAGDRKDKGSFPLSSWIRRARTGKVCTA
jgi:hypothetical protein